MTLRKDGEYLPAKAKPASNVDEEAGTLRRYFSFSPSLNMYLIAGL
jgi:hypothetical protein